MKYPPLVVIVGETASGKSELAMLLARKFRGEIVAADSTTVYVGMDIGTAKPSRKERREVPHHLLDIRYPGQRYTAAEFKQDALKLIEDISSRGKLPIMVGGSGLYIDSVIYDYQFASLKSHNSSTEELTLDELQSKAKELGINQSDVNFKNRRHLEGAVRRGRAGHADTQLRPNTLIISPKREMSDINSRIEKRIEGMFRDGLVEEVTGLIYQYGKETIIKGGNAYRVLPDYIDQRISLADTKEELIKRDKSLAKRQRTWFKRNKSIHYILKQSDAVELVTTILSK